MFVESLDRAFENVCELDLIFHFDEVCKAVQYGYAVDDRCITCWGRSYRAGWCWKRTLMRLQHAVSRSGSLIRRSNANP